MSFIALKMLIAVYFLSSIFSLASLFGRRLPLPDSREEQFSLTEWTPPVDIAEDEKEYTIKAELPGVNKEDVKVTVEGGVLSLIPNSIQDSARERLIGGAWGLSSREIVVCQASPSANRKCRMKYLDIVGQPRNLGLTAR
jgi:hypothetical protein